MIDIRLLPFAVLLLLVSLGPPKKGRALVPFVLFGIVIALKLYGSLSYYNAFSRQFPEIMACMEEIRGKSVVLPVVSIEGSNINPYTNSWGYLSLKKDLVTPYIFAGDQRPLGQRRHLFAPSSLWGYERSDGESPAFWEKIRHTYDYIVFIGQNNRLEQSVREFGLEQCRTSVIALYRLNIPPREGVSSRGRSTREKTIINFF